MFSWVAGVRECLRGRKSYVVATAAILMKLSGYIEGEISEGEFINTVLPWLAVMAGRAAVAERHETGMDG